MMAVRREHGARSPIAAPLGDVTTINKWSDMSDEGDRIIALPGVPRRSPVSISEPEKLSDAVADRLRTR